MLLIHRHSEGTNNHQGINWQWDTFSKPIIVIKIGRLVIWFRRRSALVVQGIKDQGKKAQRYFFESGILPKPNLSILPWKRWD